MAEVTSEFPTIIGGDARFKGELSFDKGVRIEGAFEGHIKSKGNLQIAEGAKLQANVEAGNVKVEGECKGNFIVSEKLQLQATAKVEGDLRATRLEIADGAIFIGNVVVGQQAMDQAGRRAAGHETASTSSPAPEPTRISQGGPAISPKPRAQEVRVG
jgi:cytoskeletal protein CcmA (bactofilin family)